MAAAGLDKKRLTDAIINRLKADIGALEKDKDDKDTALSKVAAAIAEEVIEELKQAIVTVEIPANQVIITVSGGSGAPAVGLPNSTPIQLSGDLS